jgi:hypothetical protein
MLRLRKNWIYATILAGIVCMGLAPPADGAFRLRIEDTVNNTGTVITGTTDANGFGTIVFSGTVGNFIVTVTTTITQHNNSVMNFAELDLSNVTIVSPTGGTLRITAEDTGYSRGNNPLELHSSIGGSITNGTITLQSWANGGNAVPALGTDQANGSLVGNNIGGIPAGSTPAFTPPGVVVTTVAPQGFSQDGYAPFTSGPPALYSLFSQVTMTLAAGGSASFNDNQTVTPAPAGLVLALTGLPCLAIGPWLRRRFFKVVS